MSNGMGKKNCFYVCNRCETTVQKATVYHFKSVNADHTLMSTQLCLKCRDEIFEYIGNVKRKT